jgi:hypothetical protein
MWRNFSENRTPESHPRCFAHRDCEISMCLLLDWMHYTVLESGGVKVDSIVSWLWIKMIGWNNEKLNFNSICRLCMRHGGVMSSIFADDTDGIIPSRILYCLSLKVRLKSFSRKWIFFGTDFYWVGVPVGFRVSCSELLGISSKSASKKILRPENGRRKLYHSAFSSVQSVVPFEFSCTLLIAWGVQLECDPK